MIQGARKAFGRLLLHTNKKLRIKNVAPRHQIDGYAIIGYGSKLVNTTGGFNVSKDN